MQNVKFQCGKCNSLMAVGADLLGKQVRCPHCQQVILAPARPPAPPALVGAMAPTVALPPTAPAPGPGADVVFKMPALRRPEEEGSIFNEAEEEGDDLFNSSRAPTVEMPALAPAPPGGVNTISASVQPMQAPPPAPALTPANLAATLSLPPHPSNGAAEAPRLANGDGGGTATASETDPGLGSLAANRVRQMALQRSQKENKFTLILLIVIVPYAIIMTFAVIYLVLFRQAPAKIELFPDEGENRLRTRLDDSGPLPNHLKVALNDEKPFQIGSLEVTPVKVAWQKVMLCIENSNYQPEPSTTSPLVITLKVKNLSTTDSFAPNDLFFNRKEVSGSKPYTCLEVIPPGGGASQRFYGGPFAYRAKVTKSGLWREKDPREYVKESKYKDVLKPGQEMEMIVCTDFADSKIPLAVPGAADLVWRIQLRCGFEQKDNKRGTVTTVFGVTFKPADVKVES